MKRIFLLASVIFILTACSKDELRYDPDNLLHGTWIFERYDDTGVVFHRGESFAASHCYRFNNDGTLIERKNSGWCGTPPVVYSDFEGTWSAINDSVININVGYWGGTTDYKLKILHLDNDLLRLEYEYLN